MLQEMMSSNENPSLYVQNRWMEIAKSTKMSQNVHYIQSYTHTLILKQGRHFFRTTIHITRPMHVTICYYCPLLHSFHVSGYRCGDVSTTNKSKFAQIHTIIVRKVKIQ